MKKRKFVFVALGVIIVLALWTVPPLLTIRLKKSAEPATTKKIYPFQKVIGPGHAAFSAMRLPGRIKEFFGRHPVQAKSAH
jgi:hypothetical protein